jgi:putative lipoic acid-binding regulatory protein
MRDYQNLKALLEKETYPHSFLFKFIGKNSPDFEDGTKNLQGLFPELTMESLRLSQNQKHVSYTYSLNAESADEIIQVYQAIEGLPDLELVL